MIRIPALVLLALLLSVSQASAAAPLPHPEAARTLVLATEASPEGVAVARHYMEVRGIPAENLCLVKAPATEEISREDFNATIWNPLRAFLQHWEGRLEVTLPDGDLRLQMTNRRPKYLAPVYGVPIKIKGYEDVKTMYLSTAAAVDSELALLPTGNHKLPGSLPNPYFGAAAPFGPPLDEAMVLVTRLDGPSAEIATRLVDDAVWAEANGLKGKAYIDTRSIKDKGYVEGDVWLLNAAQLLKGAGFDVTVDTKPEVFPLNFPMPDPAVYLGWYTEHVAGPIAYHLQSFSGAAIRDAKTHWVGPLLARGACVTAGAVYEPFLGGTPHVDMLMERLLRGFSWGEACYMAESQVSWQMCFIGDPLYRPFGKK
jgi:uncharacterized protein (TIGR03790 family)